MIMVYNRTADEVAAAISLRDTKVKNFIALTSEEVEILERGTLTYNTLNRIEMEQENLRGLINQLGYFNAPTMIEYWDSTKIFYADDFQRIIDNTNMLREAFFVYPDTPKTPLARYYYQNLNDIEKILHDIGVMINDVQSKYRRCGTFRCGEDRTE